MKIERIETNKIKVTLSALDLVDMNVTVTSLTPASPILTGFLHEVMEQVIEETGFNPYDGQVMVEATPEEDGIVLIVTKLSEEKPKKKKIKNVKVTTHRKETYTTYKFSGFSDLISLFNASSPTVFKNASLYEYLGDFYMVAPKDLIKNIAEFTENTTNSALSETFLTEHGKLHAKAETLVSMAEGVKKL